MGVASEARSALLIGVGRYDNGGDLPSLQGPRVDLQSLKAVLSDASIGAYQVDTLEDVDSTAACARLEDFLRERSENETCLIYYSGHGFIDAKGALYLCTTNSSFKRPKTSTIPADFLSGLIDECHSKRVLLILDCCYSGNYDGTAKAANMVEPQFGGTGYGRVVLTAGAENQLAWDNGAAGSIFSRHLANGIRTGAADVDGDGRITVHELYEYVYREVTKERPRQRPGKNTFRESGPSFLIAESPVKPQRELPKWVKHELGSDIVENRLNALKRLEAFLVDAPWAREPAVEHISAALQDDSVRVQRAAAEFLDRIQGVKVTPPPFSPPPPSRPLAEPPAEPPVAKLQADSRPVETADVSDFPFPQEPMIWTVVSTPIPVLLGIWLKNEKGDVQVVGLLGSMFFLAVYSTFLIQRYRARSTAWNLLTTPVWWTGVAALLLAGVCLFYLHGDAGAVSFVLFIALDLLGHACLLKLALRLKNFAAIGVALASAAIPFIGFGTMNRDPPLGFMAYCILLLIPPAIVLSVFARRRYLALNG